MLHLMKKLFLLLYLSLNVFALETLVLGENSLSSNSKSRLESISKHAIKLGHGTINKIYVFVDPMCPFSKKYISKISKSKTLQAVNSYYIFLYKLPKFNSNKLCQHIYQSQNSLDTLQKIMVRNEKADIKTVVVDKKRQEAIDEIAKVGEELKIEIRPYVMKFEKGSNYCIVSSGSAPCMEEFDF